MDPAAFAIMGLAVGLALLVCEFFIPSGGLISVMAVVVLSAAVWFAWRAWGGSNPAAWWTYLATLVFLIPASVVAALYVLPRTQFGRRVLLEAPNPEDVAGHTDEERRLQQLLGRKGQTVTLLNPGGLVQIDDERFHCESPGMLIDPDVTVDVIAVRGNRLVVAIPHPAAAPPDADENLARHDTDEDGDDSSPLDFEIPQS